MSSLVKEVPIWEKSNQTIVNFRTSPYTLKYSMHIPFITDKKYFTEYISNNSSINEELFVNEKLIDISKEDEQVVMKYVLEIMKEHDIITEEEYQKSLYNIAEE